MACRYLHTYIMTYPCVPIILHRESFIRFNYSNNNSFRSFQRILYVDSCNYFASQNKPHGAFTRARGVPENKSPVAKNYNSAFLAIYFTPSKYFIWILCPSVSLLCSSLKFIWSDFCRRGVKIIRVPSNQIGFVPARLVDWLLSFVKLLYFLINIKPVSNLTKTRLQ